MSRQQLIARGQEVRSGLGIAPVGTRPAMPGFNDLMDEVVFATIWDRPHLDRRQRMICTLAALCPSPYLPQLPGMVRSALDAGLEARGILEVFLQAGLYCGFVKAEAASAVAQEVFAERGIELPEQDEDAPSLEELDARGHAVMSELHGARSTQGYASADNPVTSALYPAAIRYGYGELWNRPGLVRHERMLVSVAAFTALGLTGQLAKFAQSALNNGLTKEQVIEAVVQTAPYSGFPPALNGLAVLSEVLG